MSSKLPASLQASEEDVQMMLAAQVHLGTKNCDKTMEPYVYKRRADGEWFWIKVLLLEYLVWGCEEHIPRSRSRTGAWMAMQGIGWQ